MLLKILHQQSGAACWPWHYSTFRIVLLLYPAPQCSVDWSIGIAWTIINILAQKKLLACRPNYFKFIWERFLPRRGELYDGNNLLSKRKSLYYAVGKFWSKRYSPNVLLRTRAVPPDQLFSAEARSQESHEPGAEVRRHVLLTRQKLKYANMYCSWYCTAQIFKQQDSVPEREIYVDIDISMG